MASQILAPPRVEHLTPHDLVSYSRCPHEMELHRVRRLSVHSGAPTVAATPPDAAPIAHSPLFSPPLGHPRVFEGRYDVFPGDRLIYVDEGEDDLPVLFPPEQVALDPALRVHGGNLYDDAFGLSGRPDFIVRRVGGEPFPIEYKSTHLFVGYHEAHGRAFDAIQAIAECRLVEAATGRRPTHGVVLYGDTAGDGVHEGWVEVPYGEAEEHWLRAALAQVRGDPVRAPVPSERTCGSCEANRLGLCRFAAVRPAGHALP